MVTAATEKKQKNVTFALASATALSGSFPSACAAALCAASPGGGGGGGRGRTPRRQRGKRRIHESAECCPKSSSLSSTEGSPAKARPMTASLGPKWSSSMEPLTRDGEDFDEEEVDGGEGEEEGEEA